MNSLVLVIKNFRNKIYNQVLVIIKLNQLR